MLNFLTENDDKSVGNKRRRKMDIFTKEQKLYNIDIYEGHTNWIAEVIPLDKPAAEPIYIAGQDRRALDLSLIREGFEPVA